MPRDFEALRSKPWLFGPMPQQLRTMLNPEEQQMLRWLTREYYAGPGAIIDAGCFLGGSTISFASGLRDFGKSAKIHSYDLFVSDEYSAEHFSAGEFVAGGSFFHVFERETKPFSDLIVPHAGDITKEPAPLEETEILFIDLSKTKEINDHLIREFFPTLIPGRSVVVQQDYLHYFLPWLHITMEKFADHFELLCDTEFNSAVFGLTKRVTREQAEAGTWDAMTGDERAALMDQAISRWEPPKRTYLERARVSYPLR